MAGFSPDKPVEEEQVRTEEDDLVKTTDEEEQVRTEEADLAKTTDEEEQVRTEEADPAKTTDEEEQVRTEEADPAKTTDEEERVRTNEDDPREEAIESLLDSVPNISALNLDEESEERNENPQEDSTMIPRSDQPTTNRVIQRPRLNQIASVQNNFNQALSLQGPKPVWSITDHNLGSSPNTVAWRPQTIRPNQTTSRDRQHPMANQLANIAGLQDQMFVPKPLFVTTQIFFFVQQPHRNAIGSPACYYNPLVSPEANHLNLMMPHFRRDQILTLTSPSGQPRRFLVLAYHPLDPQRKCVYALDDALVYGPSLEQTPYQFYQGPHLFFPMDIYQYQAFRNHQLRQQRQPLTQHQFRRFNDRGSSRQGQDQQQPR